MKKASRILPALLVLSFAVALLGAIPASASIIEVPPLLMTEFTMNPAGTDFQGEYVEIYNTTSEPINLKDYKLAYTNSSTGIVICFNEITKYAKSDIAKSGAVEPEKAMIEPGQCGVIWIKGNSGSSNASELTTEDFLFSYFKDTDEVNMFIAEHNVTSSSEFVTGGNFYMLNHTGDNWIYLYLVRKEATVDDYQFQIVTGFESQVAAFQTNSYVHLQFDPTNGLTKIYEIRSGDRIEATEWLGIIMPEQDPFFDPSTTTTAEETTTVKVTTTPPPETTTAEVTTPPSETEPDAADTTTTPVKTDKKSCKSSITPGVLALLLPAVLVIRKRRK
ncbi:MAG TPA: lamin tail domain-containing protein [Clostridiales bacterium]|nr:lamin tail domain-containing protein [Clostridiales bacterium]